MAHCEASLRPFIVKASDSFNVNRRALEVSGFVDVHSYRINESDDLALKNLENEERMPAGFLQLESFTLEARKPDAS